MPIVMPFFMLFGKRTIQEGTQKAAREATRRGSRHVQGTSTCLPKNSRPNRKPIAGRFETITRNEQGGN